MCLVWIRFVFVMCFTFNLCVEIRIKKMNVEKQKTISSTETILDSFPATSAVRCTVACNINDDCLYGSFLRESGWCYLYSNRNPTIEDNSNNLLFTKCYVSTEIVNITTYDNRVTKIGALSTSPTARFLTFRVKVCPPFSIHIQGETEFFFVDIGLNNGMSSRLNYDQMYGRNYSFHSSPITTCDSVSSFWITWFGDVIAVGKGDVIDNDMFLVYKIGTMITPRHTLSLRTGMVTAEWSFKINQDSC